MHFVFSVVLKTYIMAGGLMPTTRPPGFMRIMQGHGMPVRDRQARGTPGHGRMGHGNRRRTGLSFQLS